MILSARPFCWCAYGIPWRILLKPAGGQVWQDVTCSIKDGIICLNMGRMITYYTCITLMAELWCDLPVDWSRLDRITPECSRPPMRSVMMSLSQVLPSQSFMYIYLGYHREWSVTSLPSSPIITNSKSPHLLSPSGKISVALYSLEYTILCPAQQISISLSLSIATKAFEVNSPPPLDIHFHTCFLYFVLIMARKCLVANNPASFEHRLTVHAWKV